MLQVFAEGASDAQAKVALAIPPSRAMSNDLWDALRERDDEFSEAVKEGHVLAEAWWTEHGKRGLFTPEGVKLDAVSYIFNMTNRFRHEWQRAPVPRIENPEDPRDKVQIYMPANGR
jgi:hypothetical protein